MAAPKKKTKAKAKAKPATAQKAKAKAKVKAKPKKPAPKAKAPAAAAYIDASTFAPPDFPVEAVDFHLIVLEAAGPQTYTDVENISISPPDWFAVALQEASPYRYLHLAQRAVHHGVVVLIALVDTEGHPTTRVPPAPSWQRAIVDGTVHLLSASQPLTRQQIVAIIGGHEPPPTEAKPPYT